MYTVMWRLTINRFGLFLYIVFYHIMNDILDGKINNPKTLYNNRMRNFTMFYLFKAGRSWSLQLRIYISYNINSNASILIHCMLVDSSIVIRWTSPFVILGVSGLFCRLCSISDWKNPVSKQCRPCSDATVCGVWSGSALFASDPFTEFRVRADKRSSLISFISFHIPFNRR